MMHHYMGTQQQSRIQVSTGILSDGERAFFKDEKDVEDPDGKADSAVPFRPAVHLA